MQMILETICPAAAHMSVLTLAGITVAGTGAFLYSVTKMPEFLLAVFTAVVYAAVPLMAH